MSIFCPRLAGKSFACVVRIVGDPREGKSLNGREKNSGEDNFFYSPVQISRSNFPLAFNFPWVSENGV